MVLSFRNHLHLPGAQGNCGFLTEGCTGILFLAYLQLEERHKPTNSVMRKSLSLKTATKFLMMLRSPVICSFKLQLDGQVPSCVRAVLNIHFQFMASVFGEKEENAALLKPKNKELCEGTQSINQDT